VDISAFSLQQKFEDTEVQVAALQQRNEDTEIVIWRRRQGGRVCAEKQEFQVW